MNIKSITDINKILHVVPTYYPATYWGGPIFSVYGLNNALAKIPEIQLRILTTDAAGKKLQERLNITQLNHEKLYPNQKITFARRFFRNSTSPELLAKLPGLVRKADILHLTATYSFPVLPTLFFCRIYNKPLVWSPRGALLDDQKLPFTRNKILKRPWMILIKLLIKAQKTIIHATSEEEKQAINQYLPDSKIVIIPNGVDVPDVIPEHMPNSNQLRLLFLSRIDRKKNLEGLFAALEILTDPSIHLNIYGTGETRYLQTVQEQVQQSDLLRSTVTFGGHVDGDAKRAAFQNADIFILPSHSENFGIAIAEALAHGVPVITSQNTPWAETEKQKCGLWVENDPQTLANAIKTMRKLPLDKMGRNGWLWMKNEYSWDRIAKEMFQAYQELIQKHDQQIFISRHYD